MTNQPAEINQSLINEIWHYSLVSISGNEIKISNIAVALLLFVIFIHISKKITAIIVKLLSSKLRHDEDSVNTIERLISYCFWAIATLIALQVAGIPLSIFAFIGGALVIGVGFGAQSLVNNFISTIVIMLEKPIKIGDFIETQGISGRVKSVGTRCVIIKNGDSEEILIPNNSLMQNKLSRWTCNDHHQSVYHIYVHLSKENSEIDHYQIIEQLRLAATTLDFLVPDKHPEVYLTKVAKTEDQFCLILHCERKLIKSSEDIKNQINIALLKTLQSGFTVEYSKNI